MKKTAIILTLLLLLSLFTGCSAERANEDIGDDGADLTTAAPVETEAEAEPTDAEDPPAEENSPTESEHVTLSYEGYTASAAVDSVFLDDDGMLTVVLKGTGYSFNGILPFRNGRLTVPFEVDVRVGEETYSWNTVNFNGETITYLTDATELPDQIILYSSDNTDEKFTIDAAPYITDTPPVEESEEIFPTLEDF